MIDNPSDGTRSFLARLKITSTLAGIGAAGGAVAGLVLTFLGNVISGYPTSPSAAVYSWNVVVMSVLGATFGPPLAWATLRRVPLWRTLLEPAAGGIVGSVIAMAVAPALFPVIVPTAIVGCAWRLNHVYRDKRGPRERLSDARESDVVTPDAVGGSDANVSATGK